MTAKQHAPTLSAMVDAMGYTALIKAITNHAEHADKAGMYGAAMTFAKAGVAIGKLIEERDTLAAAAQAVLDALKAERDIRARESTGGERRGAHARTVAACLALESAIANAKGA